MGCLSQLPAVANMSVVLLSFVWLIVQTEAIAIKQTPEVKLCEVVHPKKLHIVQKREIQTNQTEKLAKEVSDVNDKRFYNYLETVKRLLTNRSDVTVNI